MLCGQKIILWLLLRASTSLEKVSRIKTIGRRKVCLFSQISMQTPPQTFDGILWKMPQRPSVLLRCDRESKIIVAPIPRYRALYSITEEMYKSPLKLFYWKEKIKCMVKTTTSKHSCKKWGDAFVSFFFFFAPPFVFLLIRRPHQRGDSTSTSELTTWLVN